MYRDVRKGCLKLVPKVRPSEKAKMRPVKSEVCRGVTMSGQPCPVARRALGLCAVLMSVWLDVRNSHAFGDEPSRTAKANSSRVQQAPPETRAGKAEREPYRVELTSHSPVGEASIREHAIVWYPRQRRYYLIADVVPLSSPHHPNTYNTEIHLWSSSDLQRWTYHGVAIRKGQPGQSYDGYGVATPAGAVFRNGRIYVPFSARRTASFGGRSIGLAWSADEPERLPWTKTAAPISDLEGNDDDCAVLVVPGDERVHLYHRNGGPPEYRIVHTASATPKRPGSWPPARPVIPKPLSVRAQELTAAFFADGFVQLLVIEHLHRGGIKIAHLRSRRPDGPFELADPDHRYLPSGSQPPGLAYSGHITPVARDGRIVAAFWTVFQKGPRYGLFGRPVSPVSRFP